MKQEEMVLNQLHDMGFETTKVANMGYMFSYNELRFLYMPDDDDEFFLRITVPNILDVTEDNRIKALEAMNDTATFVKYTKAMILYDGVWLTYEYLLKDNDNMEELLEHIIRALFATMTVFQKKYNGEKIQLPSDVEDQDDIELQKLLGEIDEEKTTEDQD